MGTGVEGLESADFAISDIVRTHREPLLAYVSILTGGDRQRAEDVVQETFVRAWQHLDRMRPEHGSVNGWLRRVAHNLVVDGHRMRSARPREVAIDLAVDRTEEDSSEAVLSTVMVRQALDRLWPGHREAIVEVYLHDRTAVEAADVLGIPVGTVRSRVFHALRQLRAAA